MFIVNVIDVNRMTTDLLGNMGNMGNFGTLGNMGKHVGEEG
jgi:hypothetical protein